MFRCRHGPLQLHLPQPALQHAVSLEHTATSVSTSPIATRALQLQWFGPLPLGLGCLQLVKSSKGRQHSKSFENYLLVQVKRVQGIALFGKSPCLLTCTNKSFLKDLECRLPLLDFPACLLSGGHQRQSTLLWTLYWSSGHSLVQSTALLSVCSQLVLCQLL